jgi:pimeloyl-ACP methyl ester carboxylesterase
MTREFSYPGEDLELNDETRRGLPGAFIELPEGVTHYEIAGPEDGPFVALAHGFSVPYFIWDGTFEALAAAGCRVLRYDLFGRGFSDRPFAVYDLDLFTRQLLGLLDVLAPGRRAALAGLSMGGLVVSHFAVHHPERVRRLALIDPAGFPLGYSWAYKLALLPGVGELALKLFRVPNLEMSIASDFFDPRLVEMFIQRYRPPMRYKGFRRAILSTLRAGVLEDGLPLYERVGALGLPVLLVWGREDRTVPFRHHAEVRKAIPHAQFLPVDAAGHLPHVEQADLVNPVLAEFLRG